MKYILLMITLLLPSCVYYSHEPSFNSCKYVDHYVSAASGGSNYYVEYSCKTVILAERSVYDKNTTLFENTTNLNILHRELNDIKK